MDDLRALLIRADSICSLVAHRRLGETGELPYRDEDGAELLAVSAACREAAAGLLRDSGSGDPLTQRVIDAARAFHDAWRQKCAVTRGDVLWKLWRFGPTDAGFSRVACTVRVDRNRQIARRLRDGELVAAAETCDIEVGSQVTDDGEVLMRFERLTVIGVTLIPAAESVWP